MTGEDETSSGELRVRQNVVHELGLFQGKLGFSRAIAITEGSRTVLKYSRAIRELVAAWPWLTVFQLPPNAPELNPVEAV